MADPLATPDRAEHHYRYDPAKATSYSATTLAWVGDPAAATIACDVVDALSAEVTIRRPRRLAVARLDLALALIPQGRIDAAAQSALEAMASGRVAPSNRWRAWEIVRKIDAAGAREAAPLAEAYRELIGTTKALLRS